MWKERRTPFSHRNVLLHSTEKVHDHLVETVVSRFAPIQHNLIFGSLIYPTRRRPQNVNLTTDLHHFLRQVFQKLPRLTWRDHQLSRLFVIEESEECGIHSHFLMETPRGMNQEKFIVIIRERWVSIALRDYREADEWNRLNRGTKISLMEKRTLLIKNNQIVRSSFPEPVWNVPLRPNRNPRKLADLRPVTNLRGGTGYCLKSDGNDDLNLESAIVFNPTTADVRVRGHSLSLSLW